MIPAPFEYERAESVENAIELLGRYGGDAKLLAGGHSLLPLMKLRLARPSALVDIGRLTDLSYTREDGDAVAIGALTRHHDVQSSDVLQQHCPILSHTAGLIGDPQVRHMGTIGGSAAHSDPASDVPTVLMAVNAELVVRGPNGSRTVAARDFFKGLFEAELAPDEILTEIRVPKLPPGTGWSYQKFHRRSQDWALVGVAAVLMRSNGKVTGGAVALTNMGETPIRASAVEEALAEGADPASAAQGAAEGTNPPSDTFGSAEYRRELVKVLTRRAIEEALA
jgi:aerobic carbon-monoxide dehydrogenase medium subunit